MAANLRTWAQRQTSPPVGNLIELDLSHPFFAADEWDVFYAGTYYTKQNPEGTPSLMASALLNAIKGSPAGVLYGTDSTSGTLSSRHRLFPLPDQRHVLLTLEGSAQQYTPQEGAVRTYVGITHVTASGIVRFGNGGAPGSTTRRDYTYDRGNDGTGVLIVPAASATTAPVVYTAGAQQTATYSSGTGTTYDWGTSDTWGMVGFAIGANSGEAGFCPFTAVSTAVDLPAARYAELSANPWGLIKPRRIWVPVSASGGAYTLTAEQGSYTLTGQSASLLATRALTAEQGSYALSGQDVTLVRACVVAAEQGSYTLTGQNAALLATRVVVAEQGAYTLTGQDAALTYTPAGAYTLTADSGAYALTGQDALLLYSRTLVAAQGAYALSGQDAALTYAPASSYTLTAEQGSYALSGQTASFLRTYRLSAAYGSYTLSGQPATLTYSAGLIETLETVRLRSRITQSVRAASQLTQQLSLRSQIRH